MSQNVAQSNIRLYLEQSINGAFSQEISREESRINEKIQEVYKQILDYIDHRTQECCDEIAKIDNSLLKLKKAQRENESKIAQLEQRVSQQDQRISNLEHVWIRNEALSNRVKKLETRQRKNYEELVRKYHRLNGFFQPNPFGPPSPRASNEEGENRTQTSSLQPRSRKRQKSSST